MSYLPFTVLRSDHDDDDDADINDVDINATYKLDNEDEDDLDNDDDDDVEERDSFDLCCDDDAANQFFSSDSFMNAVELLGGEVEHPRPPTISNRNLADDDAKDPPPEKPDVSEMEADEADAAIKAWRVARKRWTDRRARQRRNAKNDSGDLGVYSGDCSPMLRMMTDVMQRRLMPGDSFQNKEVLRMRIAEEANLAHKEITTVRSDKMQLVVVGSDFYIKANNTERRGWVVSTAICRDGDGPMPSNSATRKIKWLGKQQDRDSNCIDLAHSDVEDDGKLCCITPRCA